MTPEGKIWIILKTIDEMLAIAPSDRPVLVDTRELEKSVSREDNDQIFEKLAKDYRLIEILKKPDYQTGFNYSVKILNLDEFRQALNNAHIRHFGSLEMLVGDNFLAVVDVASDIMNELQMTSGSEVIIPLLPSIVRFSSLMPGDGINMRDRYCEFRWKALGYFKDNHYIGEFDIVDNYVHRWESEVSVPVDRIKFTKFYEKLMDVYKKRVKDETHVSGNSVNNLDFTDTTSRKAWFDKLFVLKEIWRIYENSNKPPKLLVPISRLTTTGLKISEINGILDGFKKDGCFDWHKGTENYEIKDIQHNFFAETYRKVQLIYDKFAKTYQERAGSESSKSDQEIIHKIEIIKGQMEIGGLPEGLKAIAQAKKENTNRFPYKLPAGTKWENFTIKFLDDENIFIQVKHIKHEVNYKEMWFVGKGKNPNPSEAWVFLKVLAKVNGELTIKDAEARDKYKKQKEVLAKALQNYFLLDYDPFYPYRSSPEKEGNSYKIKITLIPPPEQSGKKNIDENEDDLGVKEYLDKQSPQVYEEQ
ncbi:MAG: hypothetical protein A3C85_01670 [Candidatus Doudnabacteria bacterium RIFCSPHIGHO2_02_FULL_48_21]|nr:MAG: hypothetical protein A3K05_02635 [Candidatus Doudnabacteria bacterium RIFCSPHIGHO2_01_48_18]OGE77470.1 MAG: hypothetical protein A2668_04285 [Candidatus Doudnabacteria bacterium RIFCSPHIGHO2_01_FULL_48_180]OGE91551.1 MAG: hypothetical protein A3F44_03955 [Candidatus Doudnabacteria bacterium RIFCSPHIGHO2_12_FULL_47_25]OGE93141.1 MAG: hypothetical protein A3C85_01670 [Candidatus Doudnabacteria bacterium RIFCSPHIGHO2_02_FULL_48_21]OGE97261.1 MAG: hypothetical protein A3A83_01470 [Candidatu